MKSVVTAKLFRNGGSYAVRIPAGWVDPKRDVHMSFDQKTSRIYISQDGAGDAASFFEFVKERGHEPDDGFLELEQRSDQARELDLS